MKIIFCIICNNDEYVFNFECIFVYRKCWLCVFTYKISVCYGNNNSIFSILVYFLVSTKTENDAYTVVGTVEAGTAFNSAKVSYADPVTNNLVTANVNTSNMNQSFITVGSPLTVYIDKQNTSNVHAQQPFTKTIKFMIIAVLFFILSLLLFEIFVSFFYSQMCQVLGAGELVSDVLTSD